MKVELGSHTDDRGTEPYKLKLSQSRAKSAVDYIVSKGIDPSRIKGTGYGKTTTDPQRCWRETVYA